MERVYGPPLLGLSEVTFRGLSPFCASCFKRDKGLLESVEQKAVKVMRGLEHISPEERLRDL